MSTDTLEFDDIILWAALAGTLFATAKLTQSIVDIQAYDAHVDTLVDAISKLSPESRAELNEHLRII